MSLGCINKLDQTNCRMQHIIGAVNTGCSHGRQIAFAIIMIAILATANTVFRRKRVILPKTAHAQNEYSCDTFDNFIQASIDI